MKIGIIGLQPRQVADLRQRKFQHEVVCYDKKSFSRENVASFCRDMDKVILLPAHVPKALEREWIVKTKLVSMAGGVSSIISYINNQPLDTGPADVAPLEKRRTLADLGAPKQPEPVELPAPTVTIKPPKKLGQTIPQGRQSQYTWSPDESVVHPNESGEHRYDLLDAAVAGDVLRMARPKGLEYPVWRTRITSMRYNREKNKGQILEAHYYEEYVDLLVHDMGPSVEEERPAQEGGRGSIMAAGGVHIDDSYPSAPATEEPALEQSEEARKFWAKAFHGYVGQGMNVPAAAQHADHALKLYRERFKF